MRLSKWHSKAIKAQTMKNAKIKMMFFFITRGLFVVIYFRC